MLPVSPETNFGNRVRAVRVGRMCVSGNLFCMIQKRRSATMRKILLATLLTLSLPGMIAAQAITGEKAETTKKEILKIEDEKVADSIKVGSERASSRKR